MGDRVIDRLSPECRCYALRMRPGSHFDGAIGTVVGRCAATRLSDGHAIKVTPDRPFPTDDTHVPDDYWCIFAAIELVALESGNA
jgi:hypothetical protein